ncbi:MAG: helix-turn-helix transcriptional regulator [Lachnospiraceae bacterium]|nr:helix-turn-helix transcriptional regulator [Lachnospiraceae bacterium]
MKRINRIKAVLAEKGISNKWLAEQMSKDQTTVSKWCTNTSQPDLKTLLAIANLLKVDVKDLINSSIKQDSIER